MARTRKNSLPVPMSFVASGAQLRVQSFHDTVMVALQRQPWQRRALSYYEQQGHVHYAATYIGNALARVRLVAARRNLLKPEQAPVEVKTGQVAKAVAKLASPKAGQRGLLRNLGRNVFLTGECWVIGTVDPIGDQIWEALSIDEITVLAGSPDIYRRRLPGASPERLPENSLTLRVWQESPRYSELADCAMQAVLDIVEKVMLLNRAEKAAARSRFAGSGILAIPSELVPPVKQQSDKSPDPIDGNPLAHQIAEAMMAPLADEGHPSSVVPVLMFGPAEVIGKINYVSLDRPIDKSIRASIDDAIKQIAHGLDLPQEILLGTGSVNHWSAWAIREDVFQAHLQPLIELICDALTNAYLRPALQRAGITEGEDEEFIIWYDPSQLIIRPDKGDKALALYDRGILSAAATRAEAGFPETAAPSEDEYAKWVGVKLVDAQLAISGKPSDGPPTPQEQLDITKEQATHQNELAKDLATHQATLQQVNTEHQAGVQQANTEHSAAVQQVNAEHGAAVQQANTEHAVKTVKAAGPASNPKAASGKPISVGTKKRGRPLETTRAGSRRSTPGGSGKALQQASARRKKPGPALSQPVKAPVTASAEYESPSIQLAAIDEWVLETVLAYSNEVAAKAMAAHAVTAAADATPDVAAYFDADVASSIFYDAYDFTFSGLTDALELSSSFMQTIAPQVDEAVRFGVEAWRAAIIDRLNDLLYNGARPMSAGEWVEGSIRPGDIRGAITVASGGSASSLIGIPNTPAGSLVSGRIVTDALLANGVPIDGWLWHYAIGAKRRGFDGHKQLSGLVYQSPNDPELAVMPQDGWLSRDFYAIGDHLGCSCSAVPWIGPNWGPARVVQVDTA